MKTNMIFCLVVLLTLAVLPSPAAPAENLSGTWIGSVDTGGSGIDELTVVLKKAEKSYAGTINDSLGFVEKDAPIEDVVLNGAVLGFSFKAMGGGMVFAVKLTAAGDKITGELTNVAEGSSVPIEFIRKK